MCCDRSSLVVQRDRSSVKVTFYYHCLVSPVKRPDLSLIRFYFNSFDSKIKRLKTLILEIFYYDLLSTINTELFLWVFFDKILTLTLILFCCLLFYFMLTFWKGYCISHRYFSFKHYLSLNTLWFLLGFCMRTSIWQIKRFSLFYIWLSLQNRHPDWIILLH